MEPGVYERTERVSESKERAYYIVFAADLMPSWRGVRRVAEQFEISASG